MIISKAQLQLAIAGNRAILEYSDADKNIARWINELIAEGKAFASTWRLDEGEGKSFRYITSRPLKGNDFVVPDKRRKK